MTRLYYSLVQQNHIQVRVFQVTCTRLQDPAPGSYGVPGVAGEGGSSGLPPGGRGPSVSACPVPEGIDQGPAVWWEVAAWHLRQMYIVKY